MKTLRIVTFSLLLATLIAGCSKDTPYYDRDSDKTGDAVGYLDLSTFALAVTNDTEVMPTVSTENTRATTPPSTSEASGDFLVTITNNTTSAVAFSGTYVQLKAQTATPMPLAPGSYTIQAKSANYDTMADVAWETAVFQGSKPFTIIKKTTTSLTGDNAFVCTLANIKTTVSLSADLDGLFKPDNATEKLTTTLGIGNTKQVFGRTETRASYFKAVAVNNTLEVRLQGLYNKAAADVAPVYTPVDWKKTIPNCKAGQWRNITISVLNADKGNVQFQLTVETWVYDQTIDVDIQTFYIAMEEVIPDEEVSDLNAPVIALEGADITKPFMLNSSDFDFDVATCTKMLTAVATPTAGSTVEKLKIVIESDNAAFLTALATAGNVNQTVVLWPVSTATPDPLFNYVLMKPSGNDLLAKAKYAGMKGLYDFEGTHIIKFVAVDSQNRTSYTKLTVKVTHNATSEVGPAITWQGHDFATRYATTPDLTVAIDIASKTGITGFEVDIISTLLPEAMLGGLNLATHMDLVTPATPAMDTQLKTLGFPTKEAVANKTALGFDITPFMEMLNGLNAQSSTPCNCDFKLTITDASGTNVQTIQLSVIAGKIIKNTSKQ